jgi:hypothetical protein
MIGDGGCGVLQHRCGRGKRELAPIWEWRSSEGAHRRGGRQRRRSAKSDARVRPSVTGGSGPGAETVGREVAIKRGAGEELVTGERTRGSVTFERLGRRRGREGKRRGERGGVGRHWKRHTARGRSWGLAPTGGRRPDRVPAGRDPGAARRCSDRGAPGADGRAPVAVRVGRERRGVRGTWAHVGRPEKKAG